MELNWHQRPVRMMRLDYYAEAFAKVKDTDLDALARSKRDEWHCNCEWVMGTIGMAPGLGYQASFNSDAIEKHPPLGDFDFVREYVPHAHKHGIKVIAYTNMHWFAYSFAEQHPGWEQLTADGASYGRKNPLYRNGTTFCVNSKWRDWAFEVVREAMKTGIDGVFLDGPVVFPGCCYCESCRERFRSECGAEIPIVEDWRDPNWISFVQFRSASLARFLSGCRDAVRSVDPEGVVFLNAGSWQAGTWRFARSIDVVQDYQDFNGAEAFFHPGPHDHALLSWAVSAKYLAAGDKPAVVFSHHMLGPWHYIPLAEVEAELAIAQTVACGANPWFAVADYALEHSREDAMRPISRIQSFLATHEQYYTETESCADVALLNSSQTGTYYVSEYGEFYGSLGSGREENLLVDTGSGRSTDDWKKRKEICEGAIDGSYLGYFLALTRSHIPFDVLLDKHISAEGLARYRVLILPNAACLSDAQIEGIEEFVRRGGSVVAEFETGAYDAIGRRRETNRLLKLLGVNGIRGMMKPASGEEYVRVKRPHPAVGEFATGRLIARPPYSLCADAAPGAFVPSVFMEEVGGSYAPLKGESGCPSLVVREYGAGRMAYIPSLAGDFYHRFKLPDYEKLIESIVRWAHADPMMIELDCVPTVQVEPRWSTARDQILIHLVSNTGDMQRPMTQIVPLHDVRIRINLPNVGVARALIEGQDLQGTRADSHAEFVLPELRTYELIAVRLTHA